MMCRMSPQCNSAYDFISMHTGGRLCAVNSERPTAQPHAGGGGGVSGSCGRGRACVLGGGLWL